MLYTITLNPALDRSLQLDGVLSVGNMNRANLKNVVAGGKGLNCAEAAAVMGADVASYCVVGKENAIEFERAASAYTCKIRPCYKKGQTRTCLKVFDTDGTMTEINEKGTRMSGEELKDFLERLVSDIKIEGKPKFVLLSGSTPSGTEDGLYAAMIALFGKMGVPVMLDCDGESLKKGIAACPFLVKPNLAEFEAFMGYEFEDMAEIAETARVLAQKYRTRILVTMGADGMLYSDGEEILRVSIPSLPATAPVGAGDTVLGVLACGLSKGLSIEQALVLAAAASCAKVMMTPGAFPYQKDAAKYMSEITVTKWEAPIAD